MTDTTEQDIDWGEAYVELQATLAKERGEFALAIFEAETQLELAWGVIANAYGGNWEDAIPEWQLAAEDWRDKYHA